MNQDKKIIDIISELLNIANFYLNNYCETHDEYVLSNEEIREIEDEEERENARDLKETDEFLKEVAIFIEDFNKQLDSEEIGGQEL